VLADGVIVHQDSGPAVPDDLQPAYDVIRAELQRDRFAAPDRSRLRDLGLDTKALAALERGGHVVRLEQDLVLLPEAVPAAVEALRTLAQPFTASEARQALGTSRRVVLPLLALLDRAGATVRLPDDRRRLRT
jgi:selenocysteine-specific elongation factor